MLDDFRQDKPDQPLDPLSEDSSLPWRKKIGLLCLAVALIGLFIFFTSDSWSSDSKNGTKSDLAADVEQIKLRLTDLEQRVPPRPAAPMDVAVSTTNLDQDIPSPDAPAMANLKSLIEQELQETATTAVQPAPEKATASAATPQNAKKPVADAKQAYTVKKGDTLSKISQHFYGTPKKWRRIVDANREKLGQSQILKVGMTLVIPKDA